MINYNQPLLYSSMFSVGCAYYTVGHKKESTYFCL